MLVTMISEVWTGRYSLPSNQELKGDSPTVGSAAPMATETFAAFTARAARAKARKSEDGDEDEDEEDEDAYADADHEPQVGADERLGLFDGCPRRVAADVEEVRVPFGAVVGRGHHVHVRVRGHARVALDEVAEVDVRVGVAH